MRNMGNSVKLKRIVIISAADIKDEKRKDVEDYAA